VEIKWFNESLTYKFNGTLLKDVWRNGHGFPEKFLQGENYLILEKIVSVHVSKTDLSSVLIFIPDEYKDCSIDKHFHTVASVTINYAGGSDDVYIFTTIEESVSFASELNNLLERRDDA